MKKAIFYITVSCLLLLQWGNAPETPSHIVSLNLHSFTGCNSAMLTPSGDIIIFYGTLVNRGIFSINAQRVSKEGIPLWGPTGILISNRKNDDFRIKAAADGEGGAIVAWYDHDCPRKHYTFAQKIDGNGNRMWGEGGIRVNNTINLEGFLGIAPDGNGGAYVSCVNWDQYTGWNDKLYIQRISRDGKRLFGDQGIPVNSAGTQNLITSINDIIPDSEGGAIVTWVDMGNGNPEILAQRFNGQGEPLWSSPGALICPPQPGQRWEPMIVPDNVGGAIISWLDRRPGTDDHMIYAQRIDENGNAMWNLDGNFVGRDGFWLEEAVLSPPYIIKDGYNGAIFTWKRQEGLIVQRLDEHGQRMWGPQGKVVSTIVRNNNDIDFELFIEFGNVNHILSAMNDGKYSIVYNDYNRIYAQIIDLNGNTMIDTDKAISPTTTKLTINPILVYDGTGTIIFYSALRSATVNIFDVFAQRLLPDGSLGYQIR